MKKLLISLFSILSLLFVLTVHLPAAEETKESTIVKVCPMTGDPSDMEGSSEILKNYKIYFCCPDCKGDFDKLSDSEKIEKVKKALSKQESAH
jgi:hypothetical protein